MCSEPRLEWTQKAGTVGINGAFGKTCADTWVDLQTTPMPPLPNLRPPPFSSSDSSVDTSLQGVVFVPLPKEETTEKEAKRVDHIGVVLIYRDDRESVSSLCRS